MTSIIVIVIGGLTLVVLAGITGLANGRARQEAWTRIARRRRELGEWERDLVRAAESHGCPACKLLRERAELLDDY